MENSIHKIPMAIITAVNSLLKPYGLELTNLLQQQNRKDLPAEKQYVTIDFIISHYSISRSTITRAIKANNIVISQIRHLDCHVKLSN